MAHLDMNGPYPLTNDDIDRVIDDGKIGNYAYGYLDKDGVFIVRYVGRSDTNLCDRIKHGIEDMADNPSCKYKLFKFSYARNIREAYEKECRNYHDFGGEKGLLCNERHPAKPDEYEGVCPVCGE